ncbi:hypothetical protein OSB04_005139 [Centaurea solstitialis]|uniref:Cytochrome P450 n=1 Tax=Centaurea solstitialis TaxID=347529 RepID=A0AA38TFF1_9ASTR|nr:hypothetical protein OSB04_005139 [Centaurea solstitialis]
MVSLLIILLSSSLVFFLFLLSKFGCFLSKKTLPLPPGPRGIPIFGNLFQLESDLPDHLWRLSKRYGPLMSLRLGRVQTLVVSSAEMAKEILKTNDLVFCTRPVLTGQQKFSYNNTDVAFSPYNEHWRQMRKICTLHLFSSKQVKSFCSVREQEVFYMIDTIKSRTATKKPVNLSETLMLLTSNIISRVAFGKRLYVYDGDQIEAKRFHQLLTDCQTLFVTFYYKDYFPLMGWFDKLNGNIARLEEKFNELDAIYQELIDEHLNRKRPNKTQDDMVDILLKLKQDYSNSSMELTFDHVKAVLMNILFGGTDTSAATVVWAMTLLVKNPKSLKKVQQEVRDVIGNKGKVHEDDLQNLRYLKAVINEIFRLYPVVPLLLPRESRDRCIVGGYEIPKGTLVYLNDWALGRDPNYWENPEKFKPERFMGSSIDYKGTDFEFIPFGSGRRRCPAMSMGVATVGLILSNLVYAFDWQLPDGEKDIDTSATFGIVSHKKNALQLVAKVYDYGRERPAGLPIIGNLHQLDTSNLSDHLWRLSKRYGPLMSLRLGRVQTLVVSSAEMAKEILKTQDLVFCTRPVLTGQKKLSYDNKDVAMTPYSEYWRQMRKICTLHLFSAKQVNSFRSVREEEVFGMIGVIKSRIRTKEAVDLSKTVTILTSNMISQVAFGKRTYGYDDDEKTEVTRFQELLMECQALLARFYYRDHFPLMGWLDKLNGSVARLERNFSDLDAVYQEIVDEHLRRNGTIKTQDDMVDILLKIKQEYSNSSMELTFDHIKAVLSNILLGGTETSSSAVVWAMTLLIKNPKSLKKLQQEVRNVIGNKGKVHEDDVQKLHYLKAVIKETLRLFPVVPLLVPRESRDRCILGGYEIPKGTLVYVNAWAVGRDPKCWENPEEFDPERFVGSSIDYKGTDFELIPFGSGRRGCPGMLLGATTVELILSNLVYSFDWELPDGMEEIDTLTTPGTVTHKKTALRLMAKVYDYDDF